MAENLANRFTTTHSQHKYDGVLSAPTQPARWNRVLLLLLRQGPGTRGHSPGSPCQAAPDCLPGVSANKGCRKTQSPFLMWFGKGSQVQPEESLAEKVQFCISSFILRGRSVRSEDHTKKESGRETKYLCSACLFFQFTLHICL